MLKSLKRNKIKKIFAGLVAIFAVLSITSFPLITARYNIVNSKIKSNFKIAHISDLHSCYYGKEMKNLIQAVDNEQPDIVVFTGDIFDAKLDNKNTMTFIKNIANKYHCYMVAGNHEDACPNWNNYKTKIISLGINVLEGDTCFINGITISGAAKSSDKEKSFEKSLTLCKENISNDTFNILLAHYPSKITEYEKLGCFDLVLAGHAHGGQWRLPFLINGLYAPDEGLFPQYAGGNYKKNNCNMIVSRGLSRTKQIIPRIFNNPELVIINLKRPENSI